MARIVFTSNLRRHLEAPPAEVEGDSVRCVLDAVFAANPALKSYVLDDQERIRPHVVVFVNGDRAALDDPVDASSEVYVLQALSGG